MLRVPSFLSSPHQMLPAVLLAGVALGLASCSGGDRAEGDGEGVRSNVVITTTVQIGALAREVVGDALEVRTLMGPGVDPHDYEPSAAEVGEIQNAGVILRHGIELDSFLDPIIGGDTPVVTVTNGITLRAASHDEHAEDDHDGDGHEEEEHDEHAEDGHVADEEHDHDHGEYDPHVWHDPANARVMVENIVAGLAERYPELAGTFEENGAAYATRLDEVDAEIRALIETIPPEHRRVVTNHDALGYFLDRYGLELVGTVIPTTSSQGEASAQDIAALEDLIRGEGVRAIFSEGTVDPRVAEQVAADTGVQLVDDLYGDSLGEPGSGADTVDGMLLHNARRFADALR